MSAAELERQLKQLPAGPGVYLFRAEDGEVLYVGKAKSLRARVRQYFQAGRAATRIGIDTLVARVAGVGIGTFYRRFPTKDSRLLFRRQ